MAGQRAADRDTLALAAGELARLARQQGAGVRGEFVNLDCSGAKPVLVVAGAEKQWRFRVDDFGQVIVSGLSGDSVELVCGEQKRRKVSIRYSADTAGGADGVVKGIIFE